MAAVLAMSALPPKADIRRLGCDVRFVPISLKNSATVKLPASPVVFGAMCLDCREAFGHCRDDQFG